MSKGAIFLVLTVQVLIVVGLLYFALPPILWGPAPTEELTMNAYENNVSVLFRLIAAGGAAVVALIYYLCFMRDGSRHGAKPRPGDRS